MGNTRNVSALLLHMIHFPKLILGYVRLGRSVTLTRPNLLPRILSILELVRVQDAYITRAKYRN